MRGTRAQLPRGEDVVEARNTREDWSLLKRVLTYVRPHAKPLLVSLGFLFMTGALELVGPYLTKIAIDEAIPAGDRDRLLRIVGLFAGVLIVVFVTGYVQQLVMTKTGQSIMRDLRTDLFSHLQKMRLPYFDRQPTGRLVSRVTSDVETLNDLLTSGLVTIIADVVTLVGITVILFWMNPELAMWAFLGMPVIVFTSLRFRKRARNGFRATRERVARLNGVMQETFSGIEVVKLFGREPANDREFDEQNSACRDAWIETLEVFAMFFPLVQFLLAVSLALVLWSGGSRVLENTVTLGELVAFIQYVQRFFVPLRDLSEKYNVLQSAMAASERIFGILDTPVTDVPKTDPPLIELRGEIEFRNVSFHYEEGEPVLRDLSFRVAPGERIAIVGATGAGKSTILSLIQGFYQPTEGAILVDGRDLSTLDPADVRRLSGTVPQDVFLFSSDVDWNVRLGAPVSEERVAQALEAAHARTFVEALPRGLQEPLGERGRALSVGERQLLSFARALVVSPSLLLLDEATSSVDAHTEASVQKALETLTRGRTSVIVAHRLSTIRDADRILVMHHGRLAEVGSHRELLERGGLYARLVELQFGKEDHEAA